jgi:ferrochelatase
MMKKPPAKAAILLMAHGAPKSLDDVPAFLAGMRGGRPFPEAAVREITERYRRIGGRSPLADFVTSIAGDLEKALQGGGFGATVYVGMKHGKPSIEEAVDAMLEDGHSSALALPLSPYQSSMTDEAYLKRARAAASKGTGLTLFSAPPWNAHPMLVGAYAEKLKAALAEVPPAAAGSALTLFCGHSLPASVVEEGDPYDEQLRLTAAAVAQEAGAKEWMLAYQSVPRGAEGEWLGPAAAELIELAGKGGMKAVVLHPIGFLIDCLETLYDDDVLYRGQVEGRKMSFVRVPTLNDDPIFVSALAAIIRAAFAPLS